MTDHRAEFDATVTFSNGGSLRAEGFRVDVPGPQVTEDEVAALFVASLGLLMTEQVQLDNLNNLDQVPPNGARFTAAPPRLEGFGTFPVRAYAAVPA